MGPNFVFGSKKFLYLRKRNLEYEINFFSENPRQEKETSRGAGVCEIEG